MAKEGIDLKQSAVGRTKDSVRENNMAYSDKVLDHYNNPRNVGSLDKSDPQRRHRHGGRARMRRRDEAADQGERRKPASSKTPSSRRSAAAAPSPVPRWPPNGCKGKTVDEALAIKNTDIVNELSLPPVKIHCSVLAEDAIKAAIADYRKKKAMIHRGTQSTREYVEVSALPCLWRASRGGK